MPLPGHEDDLLFQKKTSNMEKLEPLKILHEDGTVISVSGRKLQPLHPLINRFLYKPHRQNAVIISFDVSSNHKHWVCDCGGKNIPFHVCQHLKNLEIVINKPNAIEVVTPKDLLYDTLIPKISDLCLGCGKKLPSNSGWCSCGTVNAEYESKLQEEGKSIGIAGMGSVEPTPKTKVKNIFQCPDCYKFFESEDSCATCPSCPMAEMPFTPVVPKQLEPDLDIIDAEYNDDMNPVPLGISKKPETGINRPDWLPKFRNIVMGDFEKPDDPTIPKMGKKRTFAKKDEEI